MCKQQAYQEYTQLSVLQRGIYANACMPARQLVAWSWQQGLVFAPAWSHARLIEQHDVDKHVRSVYQVYLWLTHCCHLQVSTDAGLLLSGQLNATTSVNAATTPYPTAQAQLAIQRIIAKYGTAAVAPAICTRSVGMYKLQLDMHSYSHSVAGGVQGRRMLSTPCSSSDPILVC